MQFATCLMLFLPAALALPESRASAITSTGVTQTRTNAVVSPIANGKGLQNIVGQNTTKAKPDILSYLNDKFPVDDGPKSNSYSEPHDYPVNKIQSTIGEGLLTTYLDDGINTYNITFWGGAAYGCLYTIDYNNSLFGPYYFYNGSTTENVTVAAVISDFALMRTNNPTDYMKDIKTSVLQNLDQAILEGNEYVDSVTTKNADDGEDYAHNILRKLLQLHTINWTVLIFDTGLGFGVGAGASALFDSIFGNKEISTKDLLKTGFVTALVSLMLGFADQARNANEVQPRIGWQMSLFAAVALRVVRAFRAQNLAVTAAGGTVPTFTTNEVSDASVNVAANDVLEQALETFEQVNNEIQGSQTGECNV